MLDYVIQYIVKQEYFLVRRKRQEKLRVTHRSFFTPGLYRQADTWDKPKEWFFTGLERFVNTGDSKENYQALAEAFPSFWPLPLQDGKGNDLCWCPEAHQLFLYYRNLLRGFWTRDTRALRDGTGTSLLFGIIDHSHIENLVSGETLSGTAFDNALAPLRGGHPRLQLPGMFPSPLARFWPEWTAGRVDYVSHLDFQRAVWLLFCESWRPKVCPKCSTYFLAQKPAQLYCSLSCSSAVHRAASLNWWKQTGAEKRAVRTKAKRRGTPPAKKT
jgi:hypothetical protein